MIELSQETKLILATLEKAGYSAYVVGGYVRDALSGVTSDDVDVATNAKPEILLQLFRNFQPQDSGLNFGVKFEFGHEYFEITTMRREGDYNQNRRPQAVHFIDDIQEDAARRDFTINALYYHPSTGILDFYNGLSDLETKQLRVIGDPSVRFREDPLRILRLMRFACVLEFEVAVATLNAANQLAHQLIDLPIIQVKKELFAILCTPGMCAFARRHPQILGSLIPSLKEAIAFDQRSPFHDFTLYDHIIMTIHRMPYDVDLRLAALFHDVGKPFVQVIDAKGVGHYSGHAHVSAHIAQPYLKALQIPKKRIQNIVSLIECHDLRLEPSFPELQELVRQKGYPWVEALIALKRADNMAKSQRASYQIARCDHFKRILDTILVENLATQISDLKLNGRDLLAYGIAPHAIQGILNHLLDAVIQGHVSNNKQALLQEVTNGLY